MRLNGTTWFSRLARSLAAWFDSLGSQSAGAPRSSAEWTRELTGNELVRARLRFDETLDTSGGDARISLLADGSYSLQKAPSCGPVSGMLPKSRRSAGKWEVTPGGQGQTMLEVYEFSGARRRCYQLSFDPKDPDAVYLNGKRYVRRFVRGHLSGTN